eukprot:g4189.t1
MLWIGRNRDIRRFGVWCYRLFSIDVISQDAIVPNSVLEWYQNELDIGLTKVTGKLLDLKLVQTRLEFYKQLGFTSYEFGELVSTSPGILDLDHGVEARENLRFLLDLGVSSFSLTSVLIHHPEFLTLSLEAHVKPRISYYIDTLQLDVDGLRKLFEQCPKFLQFSIMKDIRFRVQCFLRMGLSLEEVTSCIVLPCPQVFSRTFNSFMKTKIEFLRTRLETNVVCEILKEFPNFMHLSLQDQLVPFVDYFLDELNMGRRLLSQMIKTNPHILSSNLDREIRPKIKFIRKLGLDELEVFKVVVHSPSLFKKSLQEGVCKKIEEFKDMGVPMNIIITLLVKSPTYFTSYYTP